MLYGARGIELERVDRWQEVNCYQSLQSTTSSGGLWVAIIFRYMWYHIMCRVLGNIAYDLFYFMPAVTDGTILPLIFFPSVFFMMYVACN